MSSQLKISMKKNKKLAINIALKKEGIAASREGEQRSESPSKRQRDVFQGIDEVVEAIDDGNGMMREVDVGTGLSGALNLLRGQGTFKEGVIKIYDEDVDRFRDGFKDIQIERVDECGRILTSKEAYRLLSHGFHGKKPGKRKQEKRKKKQVDKSKEMESSDRAVERMRQVHAKLKTPYIVL